MEFLEPWFECSDLGLVDELHRELPPGHVLENVEVSVVARRRDRDDVLFALNDGSGRLALVHLTWSKTPETIPTFPTTRIFPELNLGLETMRADHNEFVPNNPDGQIDRDGNGR